MPVLYRMGLTSQELFLRQADNFFVEFVQQPSRKAYLDFVLASEACVLDHFGVLVKDLVTPVEACNDSLC